MPVRITLVFALFLAGCGTSASIRLEPKWEPLRWLKSTSVQNDTRITTIGDSAWVKDPEKWVKTTQEPRLSAILTHEQLHSSRQEAQGLLSWLASYLTDEDFARKEEELGWRAEIAYMRAAGAFVSVENTVKILLSYRHLRSGRPFWTEDQAREFVFRALN